MEEKLSPFVKSILTLQEVINARKNLIQDSFNPFIYPVSCEFTSENIQIDFTFIIISGTSQGERQFILYIRVEQNLKVIANVCLTHDQIVKNLRNFCFLTNDELQYYWSDLRVILKSNTDTQIDLILQTNHTVKPVYLDIPPSFYIPITKSKFIVS